MPILCVFYDYCILQGLGVQGESMIDLQFDSDVPHSVTQEVTTQQPKYISVKVNVNCKSIWLEIM